MSSTVFEPVLMPMAEKERLVRDLLAEFGLPVHTHSPDRHELIIPCRITSRHRNQDRDPTGAVNYDKLVYKCLGCSASGGLLWFIAEHRGSSVTETRAWLNKETGTGGAVMDLSRLVRFLDALYAGKPEKAPLPSYPLEFLDPWRGLHPWVTDPPEYDASGRNIGGWGVPEETATAMRIGYAPEYFMGKGQPTSERIVIPHVWNERLVGWQTRRIANDGTPKYKSSPDFPKDSTIFNYAPRQHDCALVLESPKSVLRHRHHLHVIATFGKDVTQAQVRLLSKYRKVVFWFDNDPGGWGAYADLKDNRGKVVHPGVLEAVGRFTDVWAVTSPYAQDAAEIDDDEAERLVDRAVPWPLWSIPPVLQCVRCRNQAHEGGCT